jgi:hypothetical protein
MLKFGSGRASVMGAGMKRMAGILAAFLGASLAMIISAQAQVQNCTTTCDEYDQGECVVERHSCTEEPPPSPNFGAIAYGRHSGAWGYSYNWDTQKEAEENALAQCKKNDGPDCEVMVWYQRECGAVASADGDKAYWGIGDGGGAAGANALASCKKDGGKNCDIQVEKCSR